MDMKKISETDRAWLAGLLEGEGCFQSRNRSELSITLAMTDEDVVWAAHAVTGLGNVTGPYKKSGNKPQWHWHLCQSHQAAAVMTWLYPYMKTRRRAKIKEIVENWMTLEDVGPGSHLRMMTHCRRGHPFSGENLKIYYRGEKKLRICRACQMQHNARKVVRARQRRQGLRVA